MRSLLVTECAKFIGEDSIDAARRKSSNGHETRTWMAKAMFASTLTVVGKVNSFIVWSWKSILGAPFSLERAFITKTESRTITESKILSFGFHANVLALELKTWSHSLARYLIDTDDEFIGREAMRQLRMAA